MSARYELHCGDCLAVMPGLEAGSCDAIIADVPYGTTACAFDTIIPFVPMWEQLKRLIKPRGAIVLFGSQPFTSALVMSNPKWFRYEWVWEKSKANNFLNCTWQPMKVHENIVVFSDKQPYYYPQFSPGKPYKMGVHKTAAIAGAKTGTPARSSPPVINEGKRHPRAVLYFPLDPKIYHPAQKPLALMEYLVRTYTNEGDTVLDFAAGSGTTGHACATTGRRFIGIERDTHYFEVAQQRIADAYATPVQLELAS